MMVTQHDRSHYDSRQPNPVASVASRVVDIAGDFTELLDLQAKLSKRDLQHLLNAARPALAGLLVGGVLGLSATTILLFAVANGVTELFRLNLWQGQLIVAGVALAVAISALFFSAWRLTRSRENLQTSLNQLALNFEWIKSVIRGQ